MSFSTSRDSKLGYQGTILAIITIISGISLLVQVLYILPLIQENDIEHGKHHQTLDTYNIYSILATKMDTVINELTGVAELPEFKDMNIEAQEAPLQILRTLAPSVNSFFVMNSTGWFVSGTADEITPWQTRSYYDLEFFNAAFTTGEIYIGPSRKSFGSNSISVTLGIPITSPEGETVGIISASVSMDDIVQNVYNYSIYEQTTAMIIDETGTVFAHSEIDLARLEDGPLSLNISSNQFVQTALENDRNIVIQSHSEGDIFGTWKRYEPAGWSVILTSSITHMKEESAAISNQILTVSIFVFVSTLVAAILVTRRVTADQIAAQEKIEYIARFPEENTNPILRVSTSGEILYLNEAAEVQLVGLDPKVGDQVSDEWMKYVSEFDSSSVNTEFEEKIGEEVYIFNVVPIYESSYINLYGRNITERKKAEEEILRYSENLAELVRERTEELEEAHEELVESERLSAIGRIASVVGHELRNPLAVLRNSGHYLKLRLKDLTDNNIDKHLNMIEQEITRSNLIISDLLDFSRGPKAAVKTLSDTETLIEASIQRVTIPKNVNLTRSESESVSISVDTDHVIRILVNLIQNAIQAMPNGGDLSISTTMENGSAVIAVKDTGTGISQENNEKIFTPLFSTKAKGTGLGLYNVKQLVEANEGSISFTSKEGEGTEFTVRLPRSEE